MMDGSLPGTATSEPGRCAPATGPKVLLLITEMEDYTIAYANAVARHARVILGVPRRQYAALAGWIDPAVDLRLLDWPRHRSLANLGLLAALWRLVRRERPDVIHLLSNNTLWLNLLVPVLRGTPWVTTVHDVVTHPGDADTARLPGWSPRMMARLSRDLVVHGESLRRMASARFGKPESRVHVVPHPAILRYADLARRKGLQSRPVKGFTVLFFGRIFAYKGIDLLFRAESLLPDMPELRVVVAGRGDNPWAFRSLMGDPGHYDIRHRFIPDLEVAQLFLDADAVVLPYSEASQSGVLHLAAAFGKPVLATDVGELGATVRRFGLGCLVPSGDAEALAREIRRLAVDPTLREACRGAALAWAETETGPDRVGALAVRLYRRLAGADGDGAR